jgi:hypothetical protein
MPGITSDARHAKLNEFPRTARQGRSSSLPVTYALPTWMTTATWILFSSSAAEELNPMPQAIFYNLPQRHSRRSDESAVPMRLRRRWELVASHNNIAYLKPQVAEASAPSPSGNCSPLSHLCHGPRSIRWVPLCQGISS